MGSTAMLASLRVAIAAISLIGSSGIAARADSTKTAADATPRAYRTAELQSRSSSRAAGAAGILKNPVSVAPTVSNSTRPIAAAAAPAFGQAIDSRAGSPQSALPSDPVERRRYERAASAFATFCRDWQRLLHERELDNLHHLSWRERGGLETALYTGYGKIESCECKASKEGLPIGKIRYEQINYSLVGKTVEEARHSQPKLLNEISTLEIFSWDKNKWFY
jgi:hypothetical protein